MIYPVISVSIPRSGHHLLVRTLQSYAEKPFHYCNFYDSPECCKQLPCRHPHMTLQKNHDFNFSVPNSPERRYIVQYRNFLEAAVSDFELAVSAVNHPDTPEGWYGLSRTRMIYWQHFVRKWIIENDHVNHVCVNYEQLVAKPVATMWQVVRFIYPGEPVREAALDAAVCSQNVQKTRDIRKFKYFDADYFAALEEVLAWEFRALGLNYMVARGDPSSTLAADVTEEAVVWAFRLLLDRKPRSRNTIDDCRRLCKTRRGLKMGIMNSAEYRETQATLRHGRDR